MRDDLLIGFIGQGFIGKNYADDFQERGYNIVRYDIDKYKNNKDIIKNCDFVFIAVPTPTTPSGFNFDALKEVLALIGKGKTAIIKSTIKLGTTEKLQTLYPDINVMHSPEFLTEKTAVNDAHHPERNIVGILDENNDKLMSRAKTIIDILPDAPYQLITKAANAEMIKYGGNCWFYLKVVFMNILYDLASQHDLDYDVIKEGMSHDSRIGKTHLDVSHQGGRGAGGHCFIKDFEALIEMFANQNLAEQKNVLETIRNMNLHYLRSSGKNLDLIKEVYGK